MKKERREMNGSGNWWAVNAFRIEIIVNRWLEKNLPQKYELQIHGRNISMAELHLARTMEIMLLIITCRIGRCMISKNIA